MTLSSKISYYQNELDIHRYYQKNDFQELENSIAIFHSNYTSLKHKFYIFQSFCTFISQQTRVAKEAHVLLGSL